MATISALAADSPYESLISQILVIERQPQLQMKSQRSEQERLKAVMSDFDSTLSALHTSIKSFTEASTNPFGARKAQVPSDAGFSVTATDAAAFGSHSLQIERLATSDARLSKQFDNTGTTLRDFFDTNGSQTFSIEVAHPTAEDADNRVAISVTINPAGTDDATILQEITAAISGAMDDAVAADTLKSTEKASLALVNETSSTSRLSLRSGQTGYDGRLSFTDSANGLLAALEVNAAGLAAGTAGGQVKTVGTSETDSALNSKFNLDGMTIYRSTNQVSDVMDGMTITLKDAGEPAADFSIVTDAGSIQGNVQSFIGKYNAVLDFIAKKGRIDGESGSRGDFAGDVSFSSLRFGMRNDMARSVSGLPDGAFTALRELGITIENDGKLTLSDSAALTAAVERDPEAVQQLFAGADGVATRVEGRVDQFLGFDGILKGRQDIIANRVKRLDNRIKTWDTRLTEREDQLRMQFAKFQETITMLQGQQQSLNSFLMNGLGYY
jgi:flagellar hook-associated protein 2